MTKKTKWKTPSKRALALAQAKFAGYHNDNATLTLLRIESRVAWYHLKDAFVSGIQAREAGVPCNCQACNQAKQNSDQTKGTQEE